MAFIRNIQSFLTMKCLRCRQHKGNLGRPPFPVAICPGGIPCTGGIPSDPNPNDQLWYKHHQGQKPGKTAPGGYVSSLTRGKNPSKVPLVIIFKEQAFRQKLHIEHLMKSPLAQSDAPGAKTLAKCPWWGCFRADQGQKPHKTAPGGYVSGLTRGKNPAKLPLVGKFQG